jgi:hypothetical protein
MAERCVGRRTHRRFPSRGLASRRGRKARRQYAVSLSRPQEAPWTGSAGLRARRFRRSCRYADDSTLRPRAPRAEIVPGLACRAKLQREETLARRRGRGWCLRRGTPRPYHRRRASRRRDNAKRSCRQRDPLAAWSTNPMGTPEECQRRYGIAEAIACVRLFRLCRRARGSRGGPARRYRARA